MIPNFWIYLLAFLVLDQSLSSSVFQSCSINEICGKLPDCSSNEDQIVCERSLCMIGCENLESELRNEGACSIHCNRTSHSLETDLEKRILAFDSCLGGCKQATSSYINTAKKELENSLLSRFSPQVQIGDKYSAKVYYPINLKHYIEEKFPLLNPKFQLQAKVTKGNLKISDSNFLIDEQPEMDDIKMTWKVKNLNPFNSYQFQVLVLSENSNNFLIRSEWSSKVDIVSKTQVLSAPIIMEVFQISRLRFNVNWLPPKDSNNLVAYYLMEIKQLPKKNSKKETLSKITEKIFTTGDYEQLSYDTSILKENTFYNLSLAAVNRKGIAGEKSHLIIRVNEENFQLENAPCIYYSTNRTLFRIILLKTHLLDPTEEIWTFEHNIQSIAAFVRKKELYVLLSSLQIYRIEMAQDSYQTRQLSLPTSLVGVPTSLHIDWLNEQMYVLVKVDSAATDRKEYIITLCDLEFTACQKFGNFVWTEKPHHFIIDPFHGFVFYIEESGKNNFQLIQMDLKTCSKEHENKQKSLIQANNLTTFVVDFELSKVLIPDLSKNLIFEIEISQKTHSQISSVYERYDEPRGFSRIANMIKFNGSLYWSNFQGDLEWGTNCNGTFAWAPVQTKLRMNDMILYHQSVQPFPMATNPVTDLQVTFGYIKSENAALAQKGMVSWQVPVLAENQNCGAWHGWTYKVFINGSEVGATKDQNFFISADPDILYQIKVRPTTDDGVGPISSTTLSYSLPAKESFPSMLVWCTYKGTVMGSDIFLNKKDSLFNNHIADFSGFVGPNQKMLFHTNGSTIQLYDFATKTDSTFLSIPSDRILGLAYEPYAKMIYYSLHLDQSIQIKSLDTFRPNNLALPRSPKAFVIDSFLAKLCWIHQDGGKVGCSDLNGLNENTVCEVSFHREFKILALTVDAKNHFLYYIVHIRTMEIYGKLQILQSSLTDPTINNTVFQELDSSQFEFSQLFYSDGKVYVLEGRHSELHIIDVITKSTSKISLKLEEVGPKLIEHVKAFTLVAENQVEIPSGFNHLYEIEVHPDPVDFDSLKIQIHKSRSEFSLIWNRVKNVNFGQVSYELSLQVQGESILQAVITQESYNLTEIFALRPPYTYFLVKICATTPWAKSEDVQKYLNTPADVPSMPRNLRGFTEPTANGKVKVTVRWDEPLNPNGKIENYKLEISRPFVELERGQEIIFLRHREREYFFIENSQTNHSILIQLEAITAQNFTSQSVNVTLEINQHSSVPKLLLATNTNLITVDLDNQKTTKNSFDHLFWQSQQVGLVSFITGPNLAIVTMNDPSRITQVNLQDRTTYNIIGTEPNEITGFEVDWRSHLIYWAFENHSAVRDVDSRFGIESVGFSLDKQRITTLSKPSTICDVKNRIMKLVLHPRKSIYLYFSQKNVTNTINRVTMSNSGKVLKIESMLFNDECRQFTQAGILHEFAIVASRNSSRDSLIFIEDISFTMVTGYLDDEDNRKVSKCQKLNKFGSGMLKDLRFAQFASEGHLYWINMTENNVWSLNLEGDEGFVMKHFNSSKSTEVLKSLFPICTSCQFLSDQEKKCLSPEVERSTLKLLSSTETSLTLRTPKLLLQKNCDESGFILPPVTYNCWTFKLLQNLSKVCFDGLKNTCADGKETIDECRPAKTTQITQSQSDVITLKNLSSSTPYFVTIKASNVYGSNDRNIDCGMFTTDEGPPEIPSNVEAEAITPMSIKVTWSSVDANSISYEIHYSNDDVMSLVVDEGKSKMNLTGVSPGIRIFILSKLKPNSEYKIWIVAKTRSSNVSKSDYIFASTYPEPNQVDVIEKNPRGVFLQWQSPILDDIILNHQIVLYPRKEKERIILIPDTPENTSPNETYHYHIDNLLNPGIEYVLKLRVLYKCENISDIQMAMFEWPQEETNLVETPTDTPLTPGAPYLDESFQSDTVHLKWKRGNEDIRMFELQAKILSSSDKNDTKESDTEWSVVYSDSANTWSVQGLDENSVYEFRVRSSNNYGWSDFSSNSSPIQMKKVFAHRSALHRETGKSYASLIGGLIAFFIIVILSVTLGFIVTKKLSPEKQTDNMTLGNLSKMPSTPRISVANPIYMRSEEKENFRYIKKIKRSQIEIKNILGSGAFGEVYEGLVNDGDSEEGGLKVAVKTLRKDSRKEVKEDFMKEVTAMARFRHENIVNLIGICIDGKDRFLILELMEGGDLLTFLRSKRVSDGRPINSLIKNSGLSLNEMICISIDIALGCEHLERFRYVHRDLAARNCLVSSRDPNQRKVKISDFGLARDIYKNDYYRTDINGKQMPVRWMSPESLQDGLFTIQSDVWSYGVLLWEILTLGQQPYPAKSSTEIFNYVVSGGFPERPSNCHDEIYFLMLKCWDFQPELRPSFQDCLVHLNKFKMTLENLEVESRPNLDKNE